MSAIQFLDNKIEIKTKFPELKKKKLTENVTLNFQLITFLSQDIVPTVRQLQEDKILPINNFYNHLEKISVMDSDVMYDIYKQNKRDKEYIKDYEVVVDYFKRLASQLLSDYQKSTDPFLEELLYAIISYQFILSSSVFVVIQQGNLPNKKLLDQIEEEHENIKLVFNKRFESVSNTKFKHGIYKNLFDKIKFCSQKQFLGLVDGTLK